MQSVPSVARVMRAVVYGAAIVFGALAVLFAAMPRTAAHQADVERWYEPQATATLEEAAATILNLQPYLREFDAYQKLSTVDQFLIDKEGIGLRATRTGVNTFTNWVPVTGGSWIGSTYVPYYGGSTVTTQVPTRQDVSIWIPFAEVDHITLLELNDGGAWPWDIHIEANSAAVRQGRWTLMNLRAQRLDQARKFIDAFVSLQAAANGFWPHRFGGLSIAAQNTEAVMKRLRSLGWDRTGVLILGVTQGSPAEQIGIRKDDVIFEVNGTPVGDSSEFTSALFAALKDKASATLQMKVFRDRKQLDVALVVHNYVYGRSWFKERPSGRAASPAPQEWWEACANGSGDVSIRACTQIIESGLAGSAKLLADAHYNRGYEHAAKEKYDLAIADLSEAIRLDPAFARAYAERGNAYREKKDFDRAIADESEAIRLDPSLASAYHNRALVYRDQREYRDAIADHVRAIERAPDTPRFWAGRCLTRAMLDRDLDDALDDCNHALQLKPDREGTLYARGFVYFRDEKFDLALADLNAAIAKDPKYARALYLRGVVRRRLRDEAGAAADIAAALALNPQLDEEFKRMDVRS